MQKFEGNCASIAPSFFVLGLWIKKGEIMKKITYEVKLEKSVKVILGTLAIGVLLNVFTSPTAYELFGIKKASAELSAYDTISVFIDNWPTR